MPSAASGAGRDEVAAEDDVLNKPLVVVLAKNPQKLATITPRRLAVARGEIQPVVAARIRQRARAGDVPRFDLEIGGTLSKPILVVLVDELAPAHDGLVRWHDHAGGGIQGRGLGRVLGIEGRPQVFDQTVDIVNVGFIEARSGIAGAGRAHDGYKSD